MLELVMSRVNDGEEILDENWHLPAAQIHHCKNQSLSEQNDT